MGCPNCKFTIRYKTFQEEVEAELKKLKGTTRKGARQWPVKYLENLYVMVSNIAASTKKVDPKWSVVTATLVSVYRGESARKQSIEHFNATPPEVPKSGPMLTEKN